MNIGNILRVADAIEQSTLPDVGFNMAGYISRADADRPDMSGHNCRTVACVAGWACSVFSSNPSAIEDVHEDARCLLGLTHSEGMSLFIPSDGQDTYWSNTIGPIHAVRVLRNLAITGKVDWEAAMKGDEPLLPPLPVSRSLVKSA